MLSWVKVGNQLRSGVNLAEDLVLQGHGVWEDVSSIETLSWTAEESSLLEAPNRIDFDVLVLDKEKLRAITKPDLGAYCQARVQVGFRSAPIEL